MWFVYMCSSWSIRTHTSLGQALWQSGVPGEALVAFRRAVALDPQNPFMVFNLGSLLHWEGEDLTAAEMALEKVGLGFGV